MGSSMSMDQLQDALTWESYVNGPKIQYFHTTDMGLAMSMDQFSDALTWETPCQWIKKSIFPDH